MSDVTTWSATDASNTTAAPDGFPDNIPVFSLPASSRAIMGAIARFYATLPGGGVYGAGTGLTLTGATFSLQVPVTVAHGGTNATSASGTALDNISGFSGTGLMRRTGAGAYSFGTTVSNGELANSSITLNGHSLSLGGSLSLSLSDISADPLAVGHGGTGGASASGTLLDNISGFSSTGYLTRTGAGAYSFIADGTSHQLLHGGGTFAAVSLTADVSGTLPVANGGTGQTSYTDGQLLIGDSSTNGLDKATLTAGSGVSITNGHGTISIAATGSGGTVTSVALTAPTEITVAGSPITSSGTLALSWTNETTNKVFAAPNGSTGTPTFRALVGADLPNPSSSSLGGVQSYASVSHQWINTISTSGVPSSSQPAFTDISGSVAASQLPNPSASTLGGIESYVAVSHQWINTISTSGVPSSTQPAFTDISGTEAITQLCGPAIMATYALCSGI